MASRINPDDAVELFRSGVTFEDIGKRYGVTREAIRQSVHRALAVENDPAGAYVTLREQHTGNRKTLTDAAVRRAKAEKGDDGIATREVERRWPDDELHKAMRRWFAEHGEPVSVSRWTASQAAAAKTIDGNSEYPSVTVYTVRYGTWNAAKKAAGLVPQESARKSYTRQWTEDDLAQWVATYSTTLPAASNPTVTGYDKWARVTPGAPSVATVRGRWGRWSDAVRAASQLEQ